MKTLLVLTLLVALVGLGVWNSPGREGEWDSATSAPYVAATFVDDLGREITVTPDGDITSLQPWQREGTKEWAEWHGKGTPQWAEYTDGRAKNADEIAKQEAEWAGKEYGGVFLPGAEMHEVSTYRDPTPMGERHRRITSPRIRGCVND